GVALAFVAFFDMLFGILLHGGTVVSCSESFSGEGSSSRVLGIDPLVYLAEDVIDLVLLDAL
ncbi:hypothetical protein A2U01_0077206, partial [Trifolium medium]|nr:hypothetical protein [Trifolium medium]